MARESTAMMTPPWKMKPSVVVPWHGLTSSTTSRSKESTCFGFGFSVSVSKGHVIVAAATRRGVRRCDRSSFHHAHAHRREQGGRACTHPRMDTSKLTRAPNSRPPRLAAQRCRRPGRSPTARACPSPPPRARAAPASPAWRCRASSSPPPLERWVVRPAPRPPSCLPKALRGGGGWDGWSSCR